VRAAWLARRAKSLESQPAARGVARHPPGSGFRIETAVMAGPRPGVISMQAKPSPWFANPPVS